MFTQISRSHTVSKFPDIRYEREGEMDRSTNMTAGHPFRLILAFAFPLILTNIGQQMYSVVDAIIVGRGIGVEAFAALGATDWCYWLDLWVVQGLAQGFGILAAQTFGAGDRKAFRRAVAMAVILCVVFGTVMTVGFSAGAIPLLRLLNTPEQIFRGAYTYLSTMYLGTLILFAYNMSAALLRAVGDGKSPLIAMAVAGVLNIVLDIVFVMGFHLGIRGAACASLLAQLAAFIYCFAIIRRSSVFVLKREDWRPEAAVIKEQCRLGIPMAMQAFITVLGGVIAQSVVNSYGYIIVAGCTATNKLHNLMDCSASAVESADATFVGQNYGAGRFDRIREGLRSSIGISLAIGTAIMLFMFVFGRQVVGLFISSGAENAAGVLDVAFRYLFIMAAFLPSAYLMHVYRGSLQGLGNSFAPMASGGVEFAARVGSAVLLTKAIGETGIFFMDGLAWFGAWIFLMVCYYITFRKASDERFREKQGLYESGPEGMNNTMEKSFD